MEVADYLKFAAALVFVLALMGGLSIVMRRLGLGKAGFVPPGKKKLRVVEVLPLDARRRLVLIERDELQHLVILGPSGETVIESSIVRQNEDTKAE